MSDPHRSPAESRFAPGVAPFGGPTPPPQRSPLATGLVIVGVLAVVAVIVAVVMILNRPGAGTNGGEQPGAGPIRIVDTEVTADGRELRSACYTLTLPEDYLLSPEAGGCQLELRLGGTGQPTGEPLTSITIRPQLGEASIEGFFTLIEETVQDGGLELVSTQRVTVDGLEAGEVRFVDANGLTQTMILLPVPVGRFLYDGEPITSFLFAGPSYNGELEAILLGVVDSFRLV